MNITLEEFKVAYYRIKPLMKETKLENFKDNIFLKKESNQISGSFKWSGVLYAVMKIFDRILKKINNCYLVTQSTGNHGIATLKAINLMINYFSEKYPNEQNLFNKITPIIFTNKCIKENKLNKMKVELSEYKNNNGKIFGSFNNYEESLKAREEFIKKHNAFYVAHGGKDILTGYGAIAEIDKQIPKNKKISFYAAIGQEVQ